MPRLKSNNKIDIGKVLDDRLESNDCQIGNIKYFKFRYKIQDNVAVPIIGFYVPFPDCTVTINLMRSSATDLNFQYGTTHETFLYKYVDGVGSYGNTSTSYVFNGGAANIYTRSEVFTPGTDNEAPYMTVRFSQPEVGITSYIAGYGSLSFSVPGARYPSPNINRPLSKDGYMLNNTVSSFANMMMTSNNGNRPYSVPPYSRYITETQLLSVSTNSRITPDIPLDSGNVNNSSLLIRLYVTAVQTNLHSNGSVQLIYYTLQGGSVTVPPYTMLLRNTTALSSTPASGMPIGSIGLLITPVLVTGSVATPPAVHFIALCSAMTGTVAVTAKVDVVCGAHNPLTYN